MNTPFSSVTRRSILRLAFAATALSPAAYWLIAQPATADPLPPVVVWKDPNCGCCNGWVEHMRRAGFHVTAQNNGNMAAVKQGRGVPNALQSCHTAVIDGYVIEGHVPAADVMRLINERPQAKGLAVPGMPASAPGMDQPGQPFTVVLFGTPAGDQIYAQH